MNDFHILSICIQNKDSAGCMRVFRDKSEFAARKIIEKLKVSVTNRTGKAFWLRVQTWLLSACRQETKARDSVHTRASSVSVPGPTQPCSPGLGEGTGTFGHVRRSHQYAVHKPAQSPDVCAWPDGLPPVHAYLGDERARQSRTSAASRKSPVDMGHTDPAGVHAGVSSPVARVRPEHSVRVCRRDAAACTASPLWKKRPDDGAVITGRPGRSAGPRKLWPAGTDAGLFTGRRQCARFPWLASVRRISDRHYAGLSERRFTSDRAAGGDSSVCHATDAVSARAGNKGGSAVHRRRWPALHAALFLLHRLCRSPVTGRVSAQRLDAREGIKATETVTTGSAGKGRRDRRKPLRIDSFCLTSPSPC